MPFLDHPSLASGPDWTTLFGRQAPLELEISFGNGQYLILASLAAPERVILGLEIFGTAIKKVLRRLTPTPAQLSADHSGRPGFHFIPIKLRGGPGFVSRALASGKS